MRSENGQPIMCFVQSEDDGLMVYIYLIIYLSEWAVFYHCVVLLLLYAFAYQKEKEKMVYNP